jgi:hypothetical protein
MGFFFGLLAFLAVAAGIVKLIEAIAQGVDYKIPLSRIFNPRWAVTERSTGSYYVFRGRWYAPTVIMSVSWYGGSSTVKFNAAKLVAKYANDNKLRGLPDLSDLRTGIGGTNTAESILAYVEEWHKVGGGKGGRVVEV